MCGCRSHTPYWGPGPQPRHVPWLEIKLATLWFAGQSSIHWATPARANVNRLFNLHLLSFLSYYLFKLHLLTSPVDFTPLPHKQAAPSTVHEKKGNRGVGAWVVSLRSFKFIFPTMLGSDSKSVRARPFWLQHAYSVLSSPLPILTGGGGRGGGEAGGGGGAEGETDTLKVVCFWENSISAFYTFECNSPSRYC